MIFHKGHRTSPADLRPTSAGSSEEAAAVTEQAHVAGRAGTVGAATLLSRLLGALRDVLMASFFGTGMAAEAFIVAFRLPEFLRRLLGEGSLSIAFVPVYTDCLHRQGRDAADRMAGSALRASALVLALATVAVVLLTPWWVQVVAPGFAHTPEKFSLTVSLARAMTPYLWCVGLVALCMGILNVLGHFAAPAFSPVCLNLAMIGALGSGVGCGNSDGALAMWLAFGVVLGGVLQLGLQVPFLVRYRFPLRHRAPLWHPALARIVKLMGPVLFGAAVFQINSLVVILLASLLPQGSVAYLYYADRLVQFPLGIFGFALATAVLPTLARQTAEGRIDAMGRTCGQAIGLVCFVTLPATVGLIVLREPIVALLFQRGAFDVQSMQLTAGALLYYAMGLWAFAAVRIVLNAFYALEDTRTPVCAAAVSIGVNALLGWWLMGPMAHNGPALALTLSSVVNFLLLTLSLRRRLGAMGWGKIAGSVTKSGICAAIMGVLVWGLAGQMLPPDGQGGLALLPGLLVCIAAGALIYAAAARIMGLEELRVVGQMVPGRIAKR